MRLTLVQLRLLAVAMLFFPVRGLSGDLTSKEKVLTFHTPARFSVEPFVSPGELGDILDTYLLISHQVSRIDPRETPVSGFSHRLPN